MPDTAHMAVSGYYFLRYPLIDFSEELPCV